MLLHGYPPVCLPSSTPMWDLRSTKPYGTSHQGSFPRTMLSFRRRAFGEGTTRGMGAGTQCPSVSISKMGQMIIIVPTCPELK